MKIEKINENKIKVLIGIEEAREWNVNVKNIASDTPEIQEMFRTAIKLAERDAEFSIDGARLFVEAIPSLSDGFGMFITRVYNDNELDRAITACPYKGTVKKRRLYESGRGSVVCARIYRLEDFENVCAAASAIHKLYVGSSTLYKLGSDYYMLLASKNIGNLIGVEKIMLEFSERQARTLVLHGRLNELGQLMIKNNAVDVLSTYFA